MNTFCKFKYFIHIFLFIIVISISAQNDAPYNIYNEEILTSSNLPLIFINTNGQIIESETRITANMGIIDNGTERNFISDEFNEYDGLISIELRGSSSAAYPKPQFRFETQDTLGENLNISLCGLPTENDWILNGPYNDRSLVRNFLSYQLSNKIQFRYFLLWF